jgi:hypothetical protein
MKLKLHRQYGGFRLSLWTTNYLRTLWVNYPHLTKLSRHGSKAHKRFQEKAMKDSKEFWRRKATGAEGGT